MFFDLSCPQISPFQHSSSIIIFLAQFNYAVLGCSGCNTDLWLSICITMRRLIPATAGRRSLLFHEITLVDDDSTETAIQQH